MPLLALLTLVACANSPETDAVPENDSPWTPPALAAADSSVSPAPSPTQPTSPVADAGAPPTNVVRPVTAPPAMAPRADADAATDSGTVGAQPSDARAPDASSSDAATVRRDAGTPKSDETGLRALAFPYIYFSRDKVLLDGIDFEATLKIAQLELEQGGSGSVMTIWAIRDQIVTPELAARISALYLKYIDGDGIKMRELGFGPEFAVWHFAWAMGNLYRLGTDDVKAVMRSAYEDALKRPATINPPYSDLLTRHLTDDKIYMGDAHDGGRSYARTHIVIPGNPDYLQSFSDWKPR